MAYMPGGNSTKLYRPVPLAVVFFWIPVPVLVAVTEAPATEAPLGSVTVPVMMPVAP